MTYTDARGFVIHAPTKTRNWYAYRVHVEPFGNIDFMAQGAADARKRAKRMFGKPLEVIRLFTSTSLQE